MKILYHHRIASGDGQYVHVEELVNAFIEQGHKIALVCPTSSNEISFGYEGGLATRLKKLLPKAIYELIELAYSLIIGTKLVNAILSDKPDFIYERYNLYQPAGVIIARLFRLPIILEVNAPLAQERANYSGLALKGLAEAIEKFTWKHATLVSPVTKVLADIIKEKDVAEERIRVIPNGINQAVYDRVPLKINREKNKKEIIIGFTGFINKWHRLDIALKAVARYRDKNLRFLCVGDGDIRFELEEEAKQLGIEKLVEFTGLIRRDEVFDYLVKFDIAIQPSITSYASPLKIFEYLAVGSLIIAPSTPNVMEVLNKGNALLFDPEEEDGFDDKLNFAIQNFFALIKVRKNAR